jgi:hypothetical protein
MLTIGGPTIGFEPPTVYLAGDKLMLPLFVLRGSGEPHDPAACHSSSTGPHEMRIDCEDGAQKKNARVRVVSGRADVVVEINGERTEQQAPVSLCPELVPDANRDRIRAEAPDCAKAGPPVIDVRFVTGPARDRGSRSVEVVAPALRLRKPLGVTSAPQRCRGALVTDRRWMYLSCPEPDAGVFAKVVAAPSYVAVTTTDGATERVAIPCGAEVHLHPWAPTPPAASSR